MIEDANSGMVMSVKEAAERLDATDKAVYALIRDGKLAPIDKGASGVRVAGVSGGGAEEPGAAGVVAEQGDDPAGG